MSDIRWNGKRRGRVGGNHADVKWIRRGLEGKNGGVSAGEKKIKEEERGGGRGGGDERDDAKRKEEQF